MNRRWATPASPGAYIDAERWGQVGPRCVGCVCWGDGGGCGHRVGSQSDVAPQCACWPHSESRTCKRQAATLTLPVITASQVSVRPPANTDPGSAADSLLHSPLTEQHCLGKYSFFLHLVSTIPNSLCSHPKCPILCHVRPVYILHNSQFCLFLFLSRLESLGP